MFCVSLHCLGSTSFTSTQRSLGLLLTVGKEFGVVESRTEERHVDEGIGGIPDRRGTTSPKDEEVLKSNE